MITIQWQTFNTLVSTHPYVNGVLTVCAGQLISLTCNHNVQVGITSVTIWEASPPVDSTSLAIHGSGDERACGPFMFGSITQVNTS